MRQYFHVLFISLLVCCILISGCTTTPVSSTPGNKPVVTESQATALPTSLTPVLQNTPLITCDRDMTNCNGYCRYLKTDIGNCGACGISCPTGQTCSDGQCTLNCKEGKSNCGGSCVNLTADTKNCGACGISCPTGQVCNNGQCNIKCINNLIYCNGQCRDLSADTTNCGACGVSCPAGQICQNGQCGAMCGSGLSYCNGFCRNLLTDSSSCGYCGVSCAAGSTCQNGICTLVPTAAPVPSWSGHWIAKTYDGDFDMYLTQDQFSSVTGTYAKDGKITGTTSGSSTVVLTGTWTWTPNGGTGPLTFTMSADGTSFTGSYANAGQPQSSTWTGHR